MEILFKCLQNIGLDDNQPGDVRAKLKMLSDFVPKNVNVQTAIKVYHWVMMQTSSPLAICIAVKSGAQPFQRL